MTAIDAWKTDDDCEEGRVIAKVVMTKHHDICVIYFDNAARGDDLAEEKIREIVSRYKKERSKIE